MIRISASGKCFFTVVPTSVAPPLSPSATMMMKEDLERLQPSSNVLITSHQAFFTNEALEKIAHITLKNLKSFFDGKSLKNEVK